MKSYFKFLFTVCPSCEGRRVTDEGSVCYRCNGLGFTPTIKGAVLIRRWLGIAMVVTALSLTGCALKFNACVDADLEGNCTVRCTLTNC